LEFHRVGPGLEAEGPPLLARLPHGNAPVTTNANSPDELVALGGFLGEVDAFCRTQGIPASVVSSEMAAGQYEINLHHVESPLAAADHAVLLRRLVRRAAQQHGMRASFMAKP